MGASFYMFSIIHSSSASEFAEGRFEGSHWSILRIMVRNFSRLSPSRLVSFSSSDRLSGRGISARKSPVK